MKLFVFAKIATCYLINLYTTMSKATSPIHNQQFVILFLLLKNGFESVDQMLGNKNKILSTLSNIVILTLSINTNLFMNKLKL